MEHMSRLTLLYLRDMNTIYESASSGQQANFTIGPHLSNHLYDAKFDHNLLSGVELKRHRSDNQSIKTTTKLYSPNYSPIMVLF